MKNPFKVGDRVAVYIGTQEGENYRVVGIVEDTLTAVGRIRVNIDGNIMRAWPQQCRRLVPKKPKHGDEIWVRPDYFNLIKSNTISPIITSPFEKHCDTYGWIKYKRCK